MSHDPLVTGHTQVEQQHASLVAVVRVLMPAAQQGEHYNSQVATERLPKLDEL